MSSRLIKLSLKGLDCANCAGKIENKINALEEVEEANLNFSLALVVVKLKGESSKEEVIDKIKKIVKDLEPQVRVEEYRIKGNIKKPITCKAKTCKANSCTDSCCVAESCIELQPQKEEHNDDEGKQNSGIKENWSLFLAIAIYFIAMFIDDNNWYATVLFLISYIIVGHEVVFDAFKNIIKGKVFDENLLMTIATFGAFAIGEYPEAVAVMIFYEIGEIFQSRAVNRSRKSIASLMNIRAEYANLIKDNKEIKVSPEELKVDDVIVIKPGERVPIDGLIIEGKTSIDTSALTGESIPRDVKATEEILAGTVNLSGVIKVKVSNEFGQSTVARILDLVENASSKKAPTEKFITKFSKYYTPIVVISAVLLAVIPPIIIQDANFSEWLYRALIFLVVSCPCALVVSIPLALFAGIGGASKKGILVKGGNYLEALKDVNAVVFDKTGTLTKGVFKVTKINGVNIENDKLLEIAALGESFSNHPIANSITNQYNKPINKALVSDYKEISGNGISADVEGKRVLLGNSKLMIENNIQYSSDEEIGTIIHIAIDNEYKGYIVISDEVKEDSKNAIEGLKKIGIKRIVMLTGDNRIIANKIGKELGIDEVYSELLPVDKVDKIEEIINNKSIKGKVAFVGDGVNDAPVLARADIGMAMGGIGSDAAIEAADVVLMKDTPSSIIDAVNSGRRITKILWQNIIFSLGVKSAVLILGAIGLANMWEGVFADVGVTIIAVINSMRALKK